MLKDERPARRRTTDGTTNAPESLMSQAWAASLTWRDEGLVTVPVGGCMWRSRSWWCSLYGRCPSDVERDNRRALRGFEALEMPTNNFNFPIA